MRPIIEEGGRLLQQEDLVGVVQRFYLLVDTISAIWASHICLWPLTPGSPPTILLLLHTSRPISNLHSSISTFLQNAPVAHLVSHVCMLPPRWAKDNPRCRQRRPRGNPGSNWIRQKKGSTGADMEPDHPITTSCTPEPFGMFHPKLVRLIFPFIFDHRRATSIWAFLCSVRIRKNFGMVIGWRLYKTRWRRLLPPNPLPCTSLSHSLPPKITLLCLAQTFPQCLAYPNPPSSLPLKSLLPHLYPFSSQFLLFSLLSPALRPTHVPLISIPGT